MRTIHFISLGCPKNRVDSEVMAGIAAAAGLEIVAEPEDADIIVVNTCAFVEGAREESVDALLEMARHRVSGRARLLVAAGCLSQRYAEELAAEMPELDHLIGTEHPERLDEVISGTAPRLIVGAPAHFLQGADTPRFLEPGTPSAYVKIGDGCSRRCAFCAIPGIRGRARSRSIPSVVAEARSLAERGVRELNLVSQDTSAYGRDLEDGTDLVALVRALGGVDGIAWIRLLYLYPDAVSARLLEEVARSEKVVPYLDVPIQHASGPMLRRMRRGHGPARLEGLIERIRRIVPGAFLRTAVLVGHPGESDADFAALLDFLERARFDHLGAFRYSDEEGTAAHGTGPAVSRRDSYGRWRKVMALGRRESRRRNRALKGTALEVLVEGFADQEGYVLVGRHPGQAPEVDGVTYVASSEARPGEIVRVRVTRGGDFDLVAEPI
jgi:ribosomal protein S12 methylthiotransferase